MSIDQAVELIGKVCAMAQGNLMEHQAIQEALSVIKNFVIVTRTPPVDPEPEPIEEEEKNNG